MRRRDRIEDAPDQLRATPIPGCSSQAEELLRPVTELYGAGLARVVELLPRSRPPSRSTALVDDELLAGASSSCTASTH